MSAIERVKNMAMLAKVNSWLDRIGERDEQCRNEVLDQCKADPDAMAYYVKRSEE